jgi:hypothetical protein
MVRDRRVVGRVIEAAVRMAGRVSYWLLLFWVVCVLLRNTDFFGRSNTNL